MAINYGRVQGNHVAAAIATLKAAQVRFPGDRQPFIASLIAYFDRNGFLTERQWHNVPALVRDAEKLLQGKPLAPTANMSLGAHVFATLEHAISNASVRGRAKVPSLSKDGVRLSIATERSSEPGTIMVTSVTFGADGRRGYFGRIRQDGTFVPSRDVEDVAEIVAVIKSLAKDAPQTSRQAGAETIAPANAPANASMPQVSPEMLAMFQAWLASQGQAPAATAEPAPAKTPRAKPSVRKAKDAAPAKSLREIALEENAAQEAEQAKAKIARAASDPALQAKGAVNAKLAAKLAAQQDMRAAKAGK